MSAATTNRAIAARLATPRLELVRLAATQMLSKYPELREPTLERVLSVLEREADVIQARTLGCARGLVLSCDGVVVVMLDPTGSEEQRLHTALHELGHVALHAHDDVIMRWRSAQLRAGDRSLDERCELEAEAFVAFFSLRRLATAA